MIALQYFWCFFWSWVAAHIGLKGLSREYSYKARAMCAERERLQTLGAICRYLDHMADTMIGIPHTHKALHDCSKEIASRHSRGGASVCILNNRHVKAALAKKASQ